MLKLKPKACAAKFNFYIDIYLRVRTHGFVRMRTHTLTIVEEQTTTAQKGLGEPRHPLALWPQEYSTKEI